MNITIKFGKRVLFTTKKNKEEKVDYPTKEEFYKQVQEIREKELESNRFKTISIFMKNHAERMNMDLEDKLFSILDDPKFKNRSLEKTYDENKLSIIAKFNEFKQFIDSLTQEQIESNDYLKSAQFFMQSSLKDCENIINELRKEMNSVELNSLFKSFRLEIEIPEETQNMLPLRISEQKAIPFYRPEIYKTEFVNLLPREYEYIYTNYNKYASKVDKLASDIYFLQMWNLLSVYEEQIDNNYFDIYNNCFEHKFLVGFFINKNKKKNSKPIKKEKLIYEEIKDELNKYLDETIGEVSIDEVEFDIEEIIEIDEVDFSVDEPVIIDSPKLTFTKDYK